jgi:hypothetical protein
MQIAIGNAAVSARIDKPQRTQWTPRFYPLKLQFRRLDFRVLAINRL